MYYTYYSVVTFGFWVALLRPLTRPRLAAPFDTVAYRPVLLFEFQL